MDRGQLSARELEIMYTLDAIDEYGSSLHLLLQDHKVSAAETEDLLRECCEMMPRVSESQDRISIDTWIGLGKIRDGLVKLAEKKLGAKAQPVQGPELQHSWQRRDQPSQQEHEQHVGVCALLLL